MFNAAALTLCHISCHVIFFFPFLKYNLSYNFKMVFTIFNPINTAHYLFIYFYYHPIINPAYYLFIYFRYYPIYSSPAFLFPLPFHLPTIFSIFLPLYLFISPLSSTLILFSLFPFIFFYFCIFLFTPFYYKFVTISFILCIVFPYKKKVRSLSLSL